MGKTIILNEIQLKKLIEHLDKDDFSYIKKTIIEEVEGIIDNFEDFFGNFYPIDPNDFCNQNSLEDVFESIEDYTLDIVGADLEDEVFDYIKQKINMIVRKNLGEKIAEKYNSYCS